MKFLCTSPPILSYLWPREGMPPEDHDVQHDATGPQVGFESVVLPSKSIVDALRGGEKHVAFLRWLKQWWWMEEEVSEP